MGPRLLSIRTFLCVFCFIVGCTFFVIYPYPYWAILIYFLSLSLFVYSYVKIQIHQLLSHSSVTDIGIALAVVIGTFFLYLYRLTEITPGAWGDEITLGLMVEELSKLRAFTPFLPTNLGHPTPLIYLSWICIQLMGKSLISLRIVSVLFGGLSVGAMYFLLRLYFNKVESGLGAVLLATSYIFVIVSRFAYEMSASVFFFILSLICLVWYYRKKSESVLILFAVMLGLGMYTYLAFRSVAVILFILALSTVLAGKRNISRHVTLLVVTLLLVLMPLAAYSFMHPSVVSARTQSLSVFNQGLSTNEVVRELQGASFRTLTMFVFTGDPNPRQNPANTPPFDAVTVILVGVGLLILFIKQRPLFFTIVCLFSAIITTEIVTLERIPEFHYYGLGHPNTLRISLLTPLITFVILYALHTLLSKLQNTYVKLCILVLVIAIIAFTNLNRYYNQKMGQWIYTTNFVVPLKIVDLLNTYKTPLVHLSPSLYSNAHISYLHNPSIRLTPLQQPIDCSFKHIPSGVSFIAADDLRSCPTQLVNEFIANPPQEAKIMGSPWNTLDVIIFEK